MKKSSRIANGIMAALVATILILSATLVQYLHGLLLSPASISTATGPKKGYYWVAAQYQIAYLQLQNQTLLYAGGMDENLETLALHLDILESKLRIISAPSELTQFFTKIPSYQTYVDALNSSFVKLQSAVRDIARNPEAVPLLQDELLQGLPAVTGFSNDVRAFEMAQRELYLADFHAKRAIVFANGVLLILFFLVTIAIMLVAIRRQRNALRREHQVTEIKHAFLAMVSHELRTPLQSITAAVDVLVESNTAPRDRQLLKRLDNAARQLETQMKDLTDYVRLQTGILEVRMSAFRLRDVIDPIIDDMRLRAAKKGLVLRDTVVAGDAWCLSDPARITQILNNLLMNAIKYTPQGEVILGIDLTEKSSDQEKLVLTVEDTGPGIPEEQRAAIFEPFTQLEQPAAPHKDGIGMGLAIVGGLVRSLKGDIVVSDRQGPGSLFRVALPIRRLPAPPAGVQSPTLPLSLRVLAVDDSEPALDAIQTLLRKLEIKHDVTSDASVAMQLLRTHAFDVVLLDLDMPDKDGATLARELRAGAGINRDTPIIAISAHAVELIPAASVRHFDGFLLKPVRLETLRDTLYTISQPT